MTLMLDPPYASEADQTQEEASSISLVVSKQERWDYMILEPRCGDLEELAFISHPSL